MNRRTFIGWLASMACLGRVRKPVESLPENKIDDGFVETGNHAEMTLDEYIGSIKHYRDLRDNRNVGFVLMFKYGLTPSELAVILPTIIK